MVYDSRNPGMDKQSGAAGWCMTQEKSSAKAGFFF